jgi:hypothetical protein
MQGNGGRESRASPQHKFVGIFFLDAQTFVLFSPKSNNCQERNHTKFSRCAPLGVRVFKFGNL